MRASTYPLVEVDEAAALVLDRTPVLGVERVALAHCVGRVLAEDLAAPASLPQLPSSAVDGYAVRSTDAGKPLRVVGESAAGRPFTITVMDAFAINSGNAQMTGSVIRDCGMPTVITLKEPSKIGVPVGARIAQTAQR